MGERTGFQAGIATALLLLHALLSPSCAPHQAGPPPALERAAEALCEVADGSRDPSVDPGAGIPHLVFLGPDLRDRLAAASKSVASGCTFELRRGDAPKPLGDGACSHHVLLAEDGPPFLGIRLRREPEAGEVHICGSWTPG